MKSAHLTAAALLLVFSSVMGIQSAAAEACVPDPGQGRIWCIDFGTRNAKCTNPHPDSCSIKGRFESHVPGDATGGSFTVPHTCLIHLENGMTPAEKATYFFGTIPTNLAEKCIDGSTVCFRISDPNALGEDDIVGITLTENKTGEDVTVYQYYEPDPVYVCTATMQISGTGSDPQGFAELGLGPPDPVAIVPTYGASGPQVAMQLAQAFNGLYDRAFHATAIGERILIPSVPAWRGIHAGASDPAFTMTCGLEAGEILFYYGHGGLNEGHSQLTALYASQDSLLVQNNDLALPDLAPYHLVFISVPGLSAPTAFFSADEKHRMNAWLQNSAHRLVLIAESSDLYGEGAAVLDDLAVSLGGSVSLAQGDFDYGCLAYECAATNTDDPLAQGLSGLCKNGTATWDAGSPVSYPVEAPARPWVVSSGMNGPCICGLGDSHTLSDPCGHLSDQNTAEFARRLLLANCAGAVPCIHIADHDTGGVRFSVTDQGIAGFLTGEQATGSGFVYPKSGGTNRLYIGSLWAGTDTTYVLNRDYDADPVKDWETLGCLTLRERQPGDPIPAGQVGLGTFDDGGHVAPRSLTIVQHSYAVADPPNDDSVILVYEVKNEGPEIMNNVWLGLFMDWDLDQNGGYGSNLGGVDATRDLVYMWRQTGGDGAYAGIRSLSHSHPLQMSLIRNSTYVWPNAYLADGDRFHFLAGDDPAYRVTSTPDPDDWGMVIGIAPFTLSPGQTVLVSFAVLAGSGLADLQANADAVAARWTNYWGAPTDVAIADASTAPRRIELDIPNPNPFGQGTTFTFTLRREDTVRLEVYDVAGRRVAGLVDARLTAGRYTSSWDGKDASGKLLMSGVYFVRLRDAEGVETRKLLIAR